MGLGFGVAPQPGQLRLRLSAHRRLKPLRRVGLEPLPSCLVRGGARARLGVGVGVGSGSGLP